VEKLNKMEKLLCRKKEKPPLPCLTTTTATEYHTKDESRRQSSIEFQNSIKKGKKKEMNSEQSIS
jgi:hypothetical protein